MNINSIKPNSSTILSLNYLGMRKRCKNSWTSALEVADFFPHIFRKKNRAKGADAATVLNRLHEAGFVQVKEFSDGRKYSITELGSTVPFEVAHRIRNSASYQYRHKFDILD
jgi:hypothetical protein